MSMNVGAIDTRRDTLDQVLACHSTKFLGTQKRTLGVRSLFSSKNSSDT
jgi:hypothetical protein